MPIISQMHNCFSNESLTHSISSCLCKAMVVETVVFDSIQGLSKDAILSNLHIGSLPAEGSVEFTGNGFKYHVAGSFVDDNTGFEVQSKGKTLFLKNIRSTVHLQGWELMTPEIYEAESANLFNVVSTRLLFDPVPVMFCKLISFLDGRWWKLFKRRLLC